MPFYDYSCEKCETIFEKYNTIDQTHKIICPECGSNKCKKILITPPEVNMGENRVKPVNYRK